MGMMSARRSVSRGRKNGDTLVTVDYDKVEMMGGRTNANMYFAYSTFGLQYPLRYWIFEAKPYHDYGWRYMYPI